MCIADLQDDKGQALAAELGSRTIFCKVNVTDEGPSVRFVLICA